QRDQHHAGLHALLDVPAHVGEVGTELPRAHRRARRARARAAHRPALSRRAQPRSPAPTHARVCGTSMTARPRSATNDVVCFSVTAGGTTTCTAGSRP